jgi:formylglycine-generating enzyme required for sulfatase activity
VVRLPPQELLPKLTAVHIAEVYGSNLMEPEHQPTADCPSRYNFATGVRGLLNERTPLDRTFQVIEALSKRIASTLGFEIDSFTAFLSPRSDWTQEQKDAILPFAQITTEVLHRLGGEYAELAQLVERDASRHSDWIKPYDDPKLPKLEELTFTTAQLVEAGTATWPPPLQVEEYTVATIALDFSEQLEPFTFKVGTLVKSGRTWKVQKSDGRAYRYIEQIAENVTLEMVGIAGGEFMMGSPTEELERYNDESPQHLVKVPGFYLGRYPVTQAQWRKVAALPQEERELNPDPSNFKGDTKPVEQVSWEDAIEFCTRLSKYTSRQYRLPTEAEWEYACRAGTTTPFHFGETISTELANYDGNYTYGNGVKGEYRQETTLVDYFEIANAWGLCDMHGNVWEWCADHWHDNYESAPSDGSAWLTDDMKAAHVNRGGSWFNSPRYCRSACRNDYYPSIRSYNLGFRVACAAPRLL